ncbi:MAG TPA: response regulator transcription factor [Bacteroidia bacterium]|jgi:DNA-binding response OmpR family regulator|nr:response regulator transcription factor [Bacteroidota bacterium]MBP9791185.1 response regulator transcription factor [Bacteroidia bacterium]MBK7571099.1 response regulator transcription factor [Bacteroidota bacterium]MBK8585405.1 response regulator transcription factor [Bacteroidota bacterium]HQV99342.1 response regulator transcription factor [Bacteroidia bacterium]
MKILIVEDEKQLLDSMLTFLKESGMICEKAETLAEASEKADLYEYDCVVLDIGLPDGSGLKVINILQQKQKQTGIVILSAKNSLDDRLVGLNFGADDYVTKPFYMPELVARIKSVVRRRAFQGKNEILFNEIRVVPDEMMMYVKDKLISLTKKEHELLLYFLSNQNKVLTKESIAEHLWGDHADMADSFDFIYSHIKNLRKKMTDNGAHDYLKSIYGVGYKLSSE